MPQPKTFLQQAVERLVGVTETMERLFEANYQDEANRTRIQGGVVRYSDEISKHLRNLGQQKGAIAAEIKVANTAYNNFIATWNNGLGDLVKSFTMLREFHRLLNERRAEIDRLINLTPNERNPPDPADKPTAQDLRHFNLIIDVADALRTLFEGCVKKHTDVAAKSIAGRVSQIVTLLSESTTPGALAGLRYPKVLWADFTTAYNRGHGINQKSLGILNNFLGRIKATVAHG